MPLFLTPFFFGAFCKKEHSVRAIKNLFGENAYRIPITANKSMTGHLLGASSAVEAISLVKTLQQNIIPRQLIRR
jgi:3-oxoacyl-(acyl-carrier-protein) synthase